MKKMSSNFQVATNPRTPDAHAEATVDLIGNIEALLRDDDEESYAQPQPTANNQHFFVVSTPSTPLNPKLSALNSNMNSAAAPFLPRVAGTLVQHPVAVSASGGASDGLFSNTPTFTPYAPLHLNVTAPPRTSTLRDAVRPGFIGLDALKTYTGRHYAVIVNNLDPRTQSKHLMSIFFPLGAVDALAFQSPVGTEEMGAQFAGRKGGIVLFASSEMAVMAASKIDDFVPHGQTLPLHTTYFGRYEDYLANKDTFTMVRASEPTSNTDSTPPSFGDADAHRSSQPRGSAAQLIQVFMQATSTSVEECEKALTALIDRFSRDPSRRAAIVITVCEALQASVVSADPLPHAQHFLRGLSRFVIQQGLMDSSTDRAVKLACGEVCGAMFALQIVRGNPFGMAARIMSEVVMPSDSPSSPLSEGLTNTVDALIALGKSWHARCKDQQEKADVEVHFDELLEKLVAEGRYTTQPTAVEAAPSTPTNGTPVDRDRGANTLSAFPSTPAAVPPADDVNTSTTSDCSRTNASSSFQVSATPIRGSSSNANTSGTPVKTVVMTSPGSLHGHHHHHQHHHLHGTHNLSIESNISSVGGPTRYSASSMHQTPEKRTVTMMDTSALSSNGNSSVNTSAINNSTNTSVINASTISTANPLGIPPLPPNHGAAGMMMGGGCVVSMVMNGNVHNLPHHGNPMLLQQQQPPFNLSLLSAMEGSNLRQHLMASTVYMTKVPLTLPHSTLRRLFDCFGEYNKVRIYEEKKGQQVPSSAAGNKGPGASGPTAFNNRGNFGFVEFVIPASSKAMVDFFRNPNTTVQTRMGISKADMDAILTMRVSYARSCIHDHDPDDAVFDCSEVMPADADSPGRKVKPCTFGLEHH